MANEPAGDKPKQDEVQQLQQELERLSAENLLLRQRAEFERLLQEDRDKQARALEDQKTEIDRKIEKGQLRLGIVGLIVLALGWWSADQPIRRLVIQRLDREFATPNIKASITEAATRAASAQTKIMMENDLKPAIDQALAQIQQEKDKIAQLVQQIQSKTGKDIGQMQGELQVERVQEQGSMRDLRQQYTAELSKLHVLLDYEEKLKDIQLLRDAAVQGDFSSFDRLASYKSDDETLVGAAQAATLESKVMYLTTDRTSAASIWITSPDGTKLADDKISTASLESVFLLDQQQKWEGRCKAASLLASRREIGVVEALLQSMQTDPNLWVRREALRAFERQTGYQEKDVFDFDGAADWWAKNKGDYLKTLPK